MKQLYKLTLVSLLAFSVLMIPGQTYAQADKACTEDANCAGPGAACVPNPLGYYPGGYTGAKNCRNYYCSSGSIQVLNSSKQVVGGAIKKGGYVRITLNSKYDANLFMAAMYNKDNPYPTPPDANPKDIQVTKAHMDKFGKTSIQGTASTYGLSWSETTSTATKSHVIDIPYAFFIAKDKNATAGNKIATNIQVNGYFGDTNLKYFSLPESACVLSFTVDTTGVQCSEDSDCGSGKTCSDDFQCVGTATTAPTKPPAQTTSSPGQGSCPANSSCAAGDATRACACNDGFYNCDNNWANGCENKGRCGGGGVCASGSDCLSGVCEDRICKPPSAPTRVPSGGECKENDECQNGFYCNSGKCMPQYCDAQRQCPGGYQCKQGVCFPGKCDANNACPTGYQCNAEGLCLPQACRADQPCPPGHVCQSDGSCKKDNGAGSCKVEADCKQNGVCVTGQCFCKDGTYNCDRDWANGCEASEPCEGSGATKLVIKAKFNGIGANLAPVKETMKVKVILANKYLQQPVEKTVDFNIVGQADRGIRVFQGTADFSNIPFGDEYSVFLKGDHHLKKRICENAPTETVDGRYYCSLGKISIKEGTNELDFTKIYQLGGDLPVSNEQSGFIDSVDITFLRSNLGNKDPGKLEVGDLNLDGIIDTQDYSLALYALSFKYDEEVTGNE